MANWMKWPGIIAGMLFMVLGGVSELRPSLRVPTGPAILFILSIVGLIGSLFWYREIIRRTTAIEYWIRPNIVNYPPHTKIGGINWNPSYTDIRVVLKNTTNRDYNNLEFIISTDMTIAEIGQVTNLPNIEFEPMGLPPGEIGLEVKGANGKTKYRIPLTGVPHMKVFSSGYRVRCPLLSTQRQIDIIIAAVTLKEPDINRMSSEDYGEKRLPKWIRIYGHYHDLGREYTFEERRNFEDQLN